jgi:3-phosphoshikimate 1-carboxyvinyltransferase
MNLIVRQTHSLKGRIEAPASKSYTHRAVIVAGMNGNATVINPSRCDDTSKAVEFMRKLGATIQDTGDRLDISGIDGKPRLKNDTPLNVGESGTLLRFALPIVALGNGRLHVEGNATLKTRPNREIVDVLRNWGVDIAGQTSEHTLPIQVNATGELKGGEANIQGSRSSQAVSSLLIVAPFAKEDTTIIVDGYLVSRPYVEITMDVLKWAGVKVEVSTKGGRECFIVRKGQRLCPKEPFTIHGDYSGAAFPLAAAVLSNSDVTIGDLPEDCQGDREIVRILERMGARIKRTQNSLRVTGPYELQGIEIDCANTPDLAPLLTVLGCFATGETRIRNVAHLRHKESNRLEQPAGELKKLGAYISFTENEIIVRHSELKSGKVASHGDHRVAMSLAVAALRIEGGLLIEDSECISKSYPDFVTDMKTLGAGLS